VGFGTDEGVGEGHGERRKDLPAFRGQDGSKKPLDMVSAFAARQRLVLGQVAVTEKSNEIVAIPVLPDMMAIEGAVVAIDVMGAQLSIARKIIDKKAGYIIAREGKQGTLHEDVKLFVSLPTTTCSTLASSRSR
jgi:hypothetical protein